jgi:hypothetical protein
MFCHGREAAPEVAPPVDRYHFATGGHRARGKART